MRLNGRANIMLISIHSLSNKSIIIITWFSSSLSSSPSTSLSRKIKGIYKAEKVPGRWRYSLATCWARFIRSPFAYLALWISLVLAKVGDEMMMKMMTRPRWWRWITALCTGMTPDITSSDRGFFVLRGVLDSGQRKWSHKGVNKRLLTAAEKTAALADAMLNFSGWMNVAVLRPRKLSNP